MACHSQWQNPRQMKSAWTLQRNDSDKTWNLEDIRSHWRYFSWRSTNFLRTLFAQQASKMTSGPGSLIRWKWRICQQHVEGRNWQQQSTHIQTSNIQQLTTLRNSTNAQTNRINTHTHTHYKANLEILWSKPHHMSKEAPQEPCPASQTL